MRTDDLVAMLARNAAAVPSHAAERRLGLAVALGAAGALALLAMTLGARPDLRDALADPMFWVKLGYPGLLLALAIPAALRLARPGVPAGAAAARALLPVAAIALLAAAVLAVAAPADREGLVFGDTWRACIVNVGMLAIPASVAALWAVRGLGPTRPVLAGAFCGLVGGAVGALAYTLHCPEMAAPFIAAWYTAGIAVPVVVGALLGPAILRW